LVLQVSIGRDKNLETFAFSDVEQVTVL